MKPTRFWMAVALAVTSLIACSSTDFPYPRLAPDFANFKGSQAELMRVAESLNLLAAKPEDDIPFERCIVKRSDGSYRGSRCVIFTIDSYQRMRKDYADAQRKLKSCK